MTKEIEADLYRYGGLKGMTGFFKGLRKPGFRYIYILRKLTNCKKYSPKWILFAFLKKHYTFKYGFQIPTTTKIGKGLYIGHFGSIIINEDVVIGNNCNLSPNVTIGETNRGILKGSPTIGNEVWIGSGAVIVGKITIGANVLIAPNSFVNSDVPNDSIVIGNPSKVISNKDATVGYLDFILN
jgi:serine O-acetyltransferase